MVNRTNCLKLAEFIEKNVEQEFAINGDISSPSNCNTPACIGGFSAILFRQSAGVALGIESFNQDADHFTQHQKLIMPKGWRGQPELYPRERAVRVLRYLAEGGKISHDWREVP